MRLKLISCRVFWREFDQLIPVGPHQVGVEYLPMGLHSGTAREMHDALQAAIDAVPASEFDAVLLGFGLCNLGLPGLVARDIPVVIPRTNDCIAMYMGSSKIYTDYFNAKPDSYFKSSGWIEYVYQNGVELDQMASGQKMGLDRSYQEMVDQYGEDNAKYLWEALHQYESRYARLTYIETGLEGTDEFEKAARLEAAQKGYDFEKIVGDMRMLKMLLAGDWNEAEFLTVRPGEVIELTYDERLIGAKAPQASGAA